MVVDYSFNRTCEGARVGEVSFTVMVCRIALCLKFSRRWNVSVVCSDCMFQYRSAGYVVKSSLSGMFGRSDGLSFRRATKRQKLGILCGFIFLSVEQ